MKILIAFILIYCIYGLEITFDLQIQNNQTEPSTVKNITLRPNEVYQHQSDYLEYSNVHFDHCQNYRGILEQAIVGMVPNRSNISAIQQSLADKYGIIYILQHESLQAYKFSQKQGSISYIDKVQFQNNHCGSQIVLTSDGQFMYHFSCYKITKLELKKSLASIKVALQLTEAFYGHKVLGADGFFIWISYTQGIRIYRIVNETLQLDQTISNFNVEQGLEKITDAVFKTNRLYLLGHSSNLYVFEQLGNGTFQSKVNISIKSLCSNCNHQQIIVTQSNIYIYSSENKQQFVSELNVNANFDKVYFVRYYKGHHNFVNMEIWNGRLLTVSNHVMNLYQINRDPRTIRAQINGISNNHLQPLIKMWRIGDNLFFKVSSTGIQLISLKIKKPRIECHSPQIAKFSVQISQLCKQSKSSKFVAYWQSCLTKDIINISVEQQRKQKHVLAVFSVFLFCTTVVVVLIMWRRNKIDIIEAIVIEINNIKNKRKKEEKIQFVEEKQVTREVNWSEIQESYGQEEKDKKGFNSEKSSENKDNRAQLHEEIHDDPQEKYQQIQMQGTQRQMETNK